MPAPQENILFRRPSDKISVDVAPVENALHSLMLINWAEELSGLSDWVTSTAAALSPAEREAHKLVTVGLHFTHRPTRRWASFEEYLHHLSGLDPVVMRDRMLDAYVNMPCLDNEGLQVAAEEVLASVDNYMAFLEGRFGPQMVDRDVESQAYTYAINPTALKILVVSHLRNMWEKHLIAEWQRVLPLLNAAVTAFRQIDLESMGRLEAARYVTRQSFDEGGWQEKILGSERLLFVPSAHVGPYLGKFQRGDTMGVIFGARVPEGAHVYAPDLDRAELVVHLSALADDTRLRILKHVAEAGEQRSQDIMNHLDLSQSAASRHLKQLSANGFLRERRCEGAKCYTLNESRLYESLQALSHFLTGQPIEQLSPVQLRSVPG